MGQMKKEGGDFPQANEELILIFYDILADLATALL